MKKIIDIALNDLLHNFRSLFAIGMMFAAPLLVTGLISFAFGGLSSGKGAGQGMKVAVVNLDVPVPDYQPMGRPLVDMLKDKSVSQWLQVVEMDDEKAALAAVDRQDAGVAVIIPAEFSTVAIGGQGAASIRIVQDPTLTIGPAIVKNMVGIYLDGINGARILMQVAGKNTPAGDQPLVSEVLVNRILRYQDWFTQFQRALNHTSTVLETRPPAAGAETAADSGARIMGSVLAGMMLFFAFYTGAYSMMSILREEEQGTLARMFTTPTSRTAILAGKFLSVFLMVLVQALVMLGIGTLAFKVRWGQPLSVALATAGQVVAAGGLGVLLISLVKTSRQAGAVLGGALTLLGMLGGLFTVNVEMPEAFTRMAVLTPQGWAVQGWKLAMSGAPAADLALTVVVLTGMGVGMFAIGVFIFRRRFA